MQLVGYKLKNEKTGEYVEQWGGTLGECPTVPSALVLENGDHICAPIVGVSYSGFVLERWYKENPVIVPDISDRQFFQKAAIENLITQEEALAAVQTGTIPAMLQTIIDGIENEDEKFAAKMLLGGATTFSRNHPLVEVIKTSLGWTDAQIDSFFISASTL